MLDLKAQIDAGLAHSNALIDKLTPLQKSRAIATAAGMSLGEIAKAEGVSKQAVSATLAAPVVKGALRDLCAEFTVSEYEGGVLKSRKNIVQFAVETIADALQAKRVITFGNEYVERPDWTIRLAAANRILAMHEAAPPIATKPPVVEEVAIEETTRRATSRRSA